MSRRKWFLRFLIKSLSQRKGRVAVAGVSVMIASAIVVSALGTSLGIRTKLGGELKAYGANVILTPASGYMDAEALSTAVSAKGVEDATGQLYAAVSLRGAQVEAMGMDLEKVKSRGWKVDGKWPGKDEVLVGSDIRDALLVAPGRAVAIDFGTGRADMAVSGTVQRGGPEDGAVLMDIAALQKHMGLEGKLSAVLVRARTEGLEETVSELGRLLPGVEVKTLRQVAYAEESFLGKIELLMALVTLVVLVATGISVSSTMSATVLERLKEIGLMKAIGGTRKEIWGFFIAEAFLIGAAGGLAGYLAGLASAQVVSKGAFGSYISVPFYVLFVSLGMGVALAVLSSLLPLADAMRYKPASILRGE